MTGRKFADTRRDFYFVSEGTFSESVEIELKAIETLLISHRCDLGPLQFRALKGDYLGETPPGHTLKILESGNISSRWGRVYSICSDRIPSEP